VGGVIGGIAGLLILLALLWFFCFRRRNNREVAFDEKTFDPANRHSVHDPIDLLAPAVPAVGNASDQGAAGPGPRVDPFPYAGAPTQSGQANYDPYSHAPMQMPDARNYLSGGQGSYPGYGQGLGAEGGYGAAAALGAGAGAGGAAAGAYAASRYSTSDDQSTPGTASVNPPNSAAAAKQREAAAERQRLRVSDGYAAPPGGSSPPVSDGPDGNRRMSGSEGPSTVYQHTDLGSVLDEGDMEGPTEIPPNYHSIPRS